MEQEVAGEEPQPVEQLQPIRPPVDLLHRPHSDPTLQPTDLHRRTSVRIRERRAKDSAHPALTQQTDRRGKKREHMATLLLGEEEPNQYKDAMASEQAQQWKIATQKEFDSLIKNNSWVLVPLPPNRS
jgi:hypothetical protein